MDSITSYSDEQDCVPEERVECLADYVKLWNGSHNSGEPLQSKDFSKAIHRLRIFPVRWFRGFVALLMRNTLWNRVFFARIR